MRRRTLAVVVVLAMLALAAGVWFARPHQLPSVAEGEALPFDEPVEIHFKDSETGETETWKLQKKQTTREQSTPAVELPEPDPAAASHIPDESARALDGLGLEAWKHGNIERALELLGQAIAVDPDDHVPRSHYGRLLTLMTDHARALPQLERAAALAPEDPQVWLDLQTLYERSQLLERAWEARARAEQLAAGRPIHQDEMGFHALADSPSIP